MKFVIDKDTVQLDYKSKSFWDGIDELEVERPDGWFIRYVEGGMVHKFDYCQSTGRGDYYDEYEEQTYEKPLAFTSDAAANAEIMKRTSYDSNKAVLIRKVENK